MGGMYADDRVTDTIAAAGNGLMYFTFSGQDLGCAVSVAVLRIMREERLVERAASMGEVLRSRLDAAFGDHPNVCDVRGIGLLQGIELVADRDVPTSRSRGRSSSPPASRWRRSTGVCGSIRADQVRCTTPC